MDSEVEEIFISFVTDLTFVASSTDRNLEAQSLFSKLISACISKHREWWEIPSLLGEIRSLNPQMEFVSLSQQILDLKSLRLISEGKVVVVSLIMQIIFLVSSMELDDSESELISLINQIVSLFNSKPDSESELVSLITQTLRLGISVVSDSVPTHESELLSLISQLVSLKPEPELTSFIRKIISRFKSMNWEPLHFISFCPQEKVRYQGGKFEAKNKHVQPKEREKGLYHARYVRFMRSTKENHFYCRSCKGKDHEEYDKDPVEFKHLLHPKHSLQSSLLKSFSDTRACYCCDENIGKMFYYCSACDFAMTLDCVKKPPPALSIDVPKWHEHPLALFPSQASLTCSLCALTQPSCPFYVCPPCDFVVHQKCLTLPKVIRISR